MTDWGAVFAGYLLTASVWALYVALSRPQRSLLTGGHPASPTPAAPVPARLGRRWRLSLLAVLVICSVGVLAAGGLFGAQIYYRTPTELVADPALMGKRVRVGGMVAPGSVRRSRHVVSFTLTDGATDLSVSVTAKISGVFGAGRDALVEGRLVREGTFRGDDVMVKHDNSYRGTSGRGDTPPLAAGMP